MQEEVDPQIGQSEIVAMRKEIHRMELMYDQLRKKQEEMIKNMERAVFKKETIQLKYQPKVEKKNAEAAAMLKEQGVTLWEWSAEDLGKFRAASQAAWPEFATTPEAKALVASHMEYLTQLGLVK